MDISWLETLSQMTDYDQNFSTVIMSQSPEIQYAYHVNDCDVIRNHFSDHAKTPMKQIIFQLQD